MDTTYAIPLLTKAKPKAVLQSWKTFNLFCNMISLSYFRDVNTNYIASKIVVLDFISGAKTNLNHEKQI